MYLPSRQSRGFLPEFFHTKNSLPISCYQGPCPTGTFLPQTILRFDNLKVLKKDPRKYCHKQIGTAFYTGVKGYVIVGVNVYVDVDMDADADVQLGEFVPEHRSLVLGALGNILSKHY